MVHSTKESSSFFFYNIMFLLVIWSNFLIDITNIVVIANATVAADGSGNYTTVMDAALVAPECSMQRYVIFIKNGVYIERVVIGDIKWNLTMIGEGMDTNIISGNLSHIRNKLENYDTATLAVSGAGFIAQDISFKNTAGPENGQAVALYSDSDFSAFYKVGIYGYQDTLCANTNRQFYKDCKISGTVDFIFGYATAVFQSCQILVKKGMPKQKNTITVQGGLYLGRPTGFSFQYCNISADSDLLPSISSTSTFLGRPWKPYSRTIFIQSNISEVLSPAWWLEWTGSQYLDTLYFAESSNYGLGAKIENRVKWSGYHLLNSNEASNFTVATFISGEQWLPLTGIPFTGGLWN